MTKSPFKFLSAYEKEEKDLFFGREEETEALYQMTFKTRLILLYGASGTGKTSLLQAGLANRFSPTRWKDILVRRNEDINQSLRQHLRRELEKAGGNWPAEGLPALEAIRQIQQLTFLPIYLIFDQFEELFILNKDPEEQRIFFNFIQELLDSQLTCKVILSMREEFLADLWIFEKEVPNLFDYRFRVEGMRKAQLEEVVSGTLSTLANRGQLQVEQLPQVSSLILERLSVDGEKIELAYLQVYLDRLYQLASTSSPESPPAFTPELVDQLGQIEDVIGDFLDDQLHQLEQQRPNPAREGIPIQLLGLLVSDEQTKKVMSQSALSQQGQELGINAEDLNAYLDAFEDMRILKRFSLSSEVMVELTHDVMAKKIWERLPEVDKALRQIRKSLKQRQMDFQEGHGSLLGAKELNAWNYYLPQLDLDESIQQYLTDSQNKLEQEAQLELKRLEREKQQIEKNRILQKRIGRGLAIFGSAIILLLIVTLFARFRLTEARSKNINFILGESQNQILHLNYRNALNLLATAYDLKPSDPKIGRAYMEIAYFYNESGQMETALAVADTVSDIFSRPLKSDIQDRQQLRDQFRAWDETYFQFLEERYYPQLVPLSGGTFTMGCDTLQSSSCPPYEIPPFQARTTDFQLAARETTVWQYHLYLAADGKKLPEPPGWGWIGDYPVSGIDWNAATAYCEWLNREAPGTGQQFRLPTETEWEYAAQSEPTDSLSAVACYADNCQATPLSAGSLQANKLGIYDLLGNVWEWCADPFSEYPIGGDSVLVDPDVRALRGGSYESNARDVTTSFRQQMFPDIPAPSYGFRVAADE